MKRRKFLHYASLLGAAGTICVGSHGWVARSLAAQSHQKRLIVIFLRGAIDGLSVVVPYREADYYELRRGVSVPKPGEEDGAIDLDGQFGLHRSLEALMPLWEEKSLAFIHACGSPDSTRSHFDAQFDMETGTPAEQSTTDGWMNRVLAVLPHGTPTQAVSVGTTTPYILKGSMAVANLPRGRGAGRELTIDRPEVNAAFDRLYSGSDALARAYRDGDAAREILMAELQAETQEANAGAPPPEDFVRNARRMARLMVGDARTQLGFLELGGWDTHINQKGRLNRALKPVGEGLAVLARELGSLYEDTAIVVMSEFGRTVAANGNSGTDHGYGNAMWVLGGGIRGGRVLGEWPGLAESQRYEGRDLAITTDFRDAIAPLLTQHLQIPETKLSDIFPGFQANPKLTLL
ncbi:DUF1501 domain-containing protein [Oscillatoriales cyanobacterium LEGE 11467]|uniref:DUF1501 domain-containing protein n=1 Tax=Zarconia navalis LEGE 11467 TaxID=1828826 RepID=A0A928VW74_9CYAN|nr:DUF1501 domain-containing protein [Zarconia navalis]MBE9041464.1 DUF1501 domain-containing protein [Zarconia navalis LEGE 11467]